MTTSLPRHGTRAVRERLHPRRGPLGGTAVRRPPHRESLRCPLPSPKRGGSPRPRRRRRRPSGIHGMLRGECGRSPGIERLVERLERDTFDLVSIGRALSADAGWADEVLHGREGRADPLRSPRPGDLRLSRRVGASGSSLRGRPRFPSLLTGRHDAPPQRERSARSLVPSASKPSALTLRETSRRHPVESAHFPPTLKSPIPA